jgi:mRNA-degrading endonuclease toxin of MazEF toxin-antitoxin module
VDAASRIRLGTIILAEVNDPETNRASGEHPAVVLSPQADIDAGMDLVAAVCTTNFTYPLESGWFDMPTRPGGHETTGLTDACVVKATWLAVVPQSKVLKVKGRAPMAVARQVQAWLRDKQRQLGRNRPDP